MTVAVTDTPGASYTWANSGWSWSDVRAAKTWANAHVSLYSLDAGEAVTFAEAVTRGILMLFAESVGFQEVIAKSFDMPVAEAFAFAETYGDAIAFVLRFMENVTFSEQLGNGVGKFTDEYFTVTESGFKKDIALGIAEALQFVETFGRAVAFKLALAESLSFAEAISKAFALNKSEAFALFEEYRRRGNAVISDMIAATGDITALDFQNIVDAGHAPGFAPFRDFVPGDYEYQQAIFRAVLESINSDRARITKLNVQVDVPDVFDSGSAIIAPANASTGVRVNFARSFHIIPEITMTLKGGTVVAIPKSVSPDAAGFTAMLIDPATGNGVAGEITWAAHGY